MTDSLLLLTYGEEMLPFSWARSLAQFSLLPSA